MIFAPLMAGTWYPDAAVIMLKDINGVAVNVGDTVYVPVVVDKLLPSSTYVGSALVHTKYGPPVAATLSTLNVTH